MNALTFETAVTADHQLHYELPASLPIGSTVRVTVELVLHDPILDHYQPRTEIGHKLLALRRTYLESSGKLMNWDEIDEEVRQRRGGLEDE